MPQSIRRRLPAASTRYLEPVTVPAAPRKVSLGIGVSLYRRDRRSQCVGIQKVLKRKDRRERRKKSRRNLTRRRGGRRDGNRQRTITSCRDGARQCCAPTGRYRTGMSARAAG